MSSSIFFKFKSQKQPTQITFDGSSLSVFEVKRDIIALSKLGDGTDFDLDISSADTNEVYDDDTTQIPRSTTVVARRLPATRPGAGRAARYVSGKMPVTAKNQHRIEAGLKPTSAGPAPVSTHASTQPMTEDEQLQAMFSENKASWQEAQAEIAAKGVNNKPFFPKSTAVPDKPVPDGYLCHRCGQKGHWIQACPTNADPNFDGRPKFRRTTGIPRSFLQKVDKPVAIDEDGKVDVSKLPAGVMYTPEGDWVIARPDEASWERFQKQTQASTEQHKLAADELKLIQELGLEDPLGHGLLDDPVKTPCCDTTYSRPTIENELIEKDFVCPSCGNQVLLDDLTTDDDAAAKVKIYKEEAAERLRSAAAAAANTEVDAETVTTEATKAKSPSPTPSKKRAAEDEPEDDRNTKAVKETKPTASSNASGKDISKAAANGVPTQKDMADFIAQMNQMAGSMPGMQNGMPAFANPMMMNPMMFQMGMMPGMMPNMGMMSGFNAMNWQNGQQFNGQNMNNNNGDGAFFRPPVHSSRHRQRQNRPRSNDYKHL